MVHAGVGNGPMFADSGSVRPNASMLLMRKTTSETVSIWGRRSDMREGDGLLLRWPQRELSFAGEVDGFTETRSASYGAWKPRGILDHFVQIADARTLVTCRGVAAVPGEIGAGCPTWRARPPRYPGLPIGVVSGKFVDMFFRTLIVLLALPIVAQADVDFSNYDVPLYTQIVDRIKAKVSARLGEGNNTRDRFFIIPFAYEDRGNHPEHSHSFISVIRVLRDNKQPKLTPGLKTRRYRNREFEAFTISWLPRDFMSNPHLCVFDGVGSRIIPENNNVPYRPAETLISKKRASLPSDQKNAVAMWGPYEIKQGAFDLAVKRKKLLDGGTIKYRADDRLYQKDKVAISCFHAMAGLDQLFPKGGFLGTGLKMWGFNGTARVLIEYSKKASYKGLLLEPVDEKKDRYGFVYASARNGDVPYNPVKNASAYQR